MKFAVVAPVYCGASSLPEFHRRLTAVLDAEAFDAEVSYVDDASPDESWSVITQLAVSDPRVRGIRLAHNVRQTRAIFAGVAEAGPGRDIIVLDTDLEDPPEAIPALVERFRSGHDLVLATRVRRQASLLRRLGSVFVNAIARLLRLPVQDVGSSFLVADRGLADRLLAATSDQTMPHLMLPEVVSASVSPATVQVRSGEESPSGYTPMAIVVLAAGFLRAYTLGPLSRLSAIVGAGGLGVAQFLAPGTSRRWWRGIGLVGLGVGGALFLLGRRPLHVRPQAPLVVRERVAGPTGA